MGGDTSAVKKRHDRNSISDKENTKYRRRREGRWTPIRAKAQDTRANPNSWETHLVRKRWEIGLLRALSLRIMMMMMTVRRTAACLILGCESPFWGDGSPVRVYQSSSTGGGTHHLGGRS